MSPPQACSSTHPRRTRTRQSVSPYPIPFCARAVWLLCWTVVVVLLLLDGAVVVTATAVRPRTCHGVPHHVHLAVGPDPASSMTISFASTAGYQAPPAVVGVAIGQENNGNFEYIVVQENSNSSSHGDNLISGYHVPVYDDRHANGPAPKDDDKKKKQQQQHDTGSGGWYWSHHYHHVTVTNLQPNTTYYYRPLVANSRAELHTTTTTTTTLGEGQPYGNNNNNNNNNSKTVVTNHESAEAAVQQQHVTLNHQGQRRRQLANWDTSHNPCPAANRIRWFTTAPVFVQNNNKNNNNNTKDSSSSSSSSNPTTTTLAVLGDLGQSTHSALVLQDLYDQSSRSASSSSLNVVLLVGDISYAGSNENAWDVFMDFWDDMELPERIPIHICPGNHDVEPQPNKAMFQAFEHRFRMPRVQPAELGHATHTNHRDHPEYPLPYDYGNAYHEFVYGAAHVFMLSAYSSMEPTSKQYKWLTETLTHKVDRDRTPWLIVGIHVPLYNTYHTHRDDPQILAAWQHLEPLFVQYRVNVVVSGHVHAYMRTHPVKMGQVDPTGPVYMIVGSSGYQASGKSFHSATAEEFVAARDETRFGYGLLHIYNATTAAWEWKHSGSPSRSANRVFGWNETLPTDFDTDHVILENQYYL